MALNSRRRFSSTHFRGLLVPESMSERYYLLKETVRQKISDNLCGSCIGCLLNIEEDHSCELNCWNLISQFAFCFNTEKSARIEVFRLRLLFDLLSECVGNRQEVRRHFKNYKRANPEFISNKENYAPVMF